MPGNIHPNRRRFLGAAAIATTALAARSASAEAEKPTFVDTHVHCFAGKDDPRFPYHPRGPYQPTDKASPEDLLRCMDEAGVAHAVIVHPEPYQDDHRYLEHVLAVGKGRLKGTLLLFSDQPASLKQLPDLAKRLAVIAVRVHAYAPERLPPWDKPQLKELWKTAGDLGLAVQLHLEPRYAPRFEPYLKEFPRTRVIIDHLGRPFQGTPDEHAVIVRWSRFEQTVMKLSSLPSTRNYPHRDPAPVIRDLTSAFGAERMIYGGGFEAGATGASYRAAFARARAFLAHLSAAEQNQILGQTAQKLFFA